MPRITLAAAILLTLLHAGASAAADFSDPTWPCIQRKVEGLSPGLMWPHPIEETAFDAETEAAVADLAGRMALRRVSLEELQPRVAAFTATHGTDAALLGHLFMVAFDSLSGQRLKIIRGIETFSLKQIALAERIDLTRGEIERLMAAEPPDFDRVDALEEQLAWDERIFTDRQKSLTYVCETPVLIEKRLYALAQMLAEAAEP